MDRETDSIAYMVRLPQGHLVILPEPQGSSISKVGTAAESGRKAKHALTLPGWGTGMGVVPGIHISRYHVPRHGMGLPGWPQVWDYIGTKAMTPLTNTPTDAPRL